MNAIDAYIKQFPKEVQTILQQVRGTIRSVSPHAEETMSYGIPTFKLNGKNLVHFAAFKKHIGFYPTPSGVVAFKDAFAKYSSSEGSVQFPLDKPVPYSLIKRVVTFRVKEILSQTKSSASKKTKK